jgi:hypothetical protein
MASLNFNAANVAPATRPGPIPKGPYLAHVIESDLQPLKSGNGEDLKLVFEVLDGEFKGRKVIERLNIVHNNAQTQNIAQGQLSALCHAIQVIELRDSAMLHYKPVRISVTIREQAGYDPQNSVNGFEAAGSGAPMQTHAAPFQQSAAAPAANSAPAWARKAA